MSRPGGPGGSSASLQEAALSLLRQTILFNLLWLIFRKVLTTGELIAMKFISTSNFGSLRGLGNIILSCREVDPSIAAFDFNGQPACCFSLLTTFSETTPV